MIARQGLRADRDPVPAGKAGTFGYWLRQRDSRYLTRRARSVASRYGLRPERAQERTLRFVDLLARAGAVPTLATPGRVVARHPAFMRRLHEEHGVELAVHAFDHVDLRGLSTAQQRNQLELAVRAFDAAGLPVTGFRCPYLGYRPTMRDVVSDRFAYSSNAAVWWDVVPTEGERDHVFTALQRFYEPRPADEAPVVPYDVDGLLELPVSLPDDLQLLDGLGYGLDGLLRAWCEVLDLVRARGELLVLLTHPETADLYPETYEMLLDGVADARASTWLARLVDVADWWRERETFTAACRGDEVLVHATPRATVLTRGLATTGPEWPDGYRASTERAFPVPPGGVPFVGLAPAVRDLAPGLRTEGFVVVTGSEAGACATLLDGAALGPSPSVADALGCLASLDTPLVRFARWPHGNGSALCVTGDLDALSLGDYADRLRLIGPGRSRQGVDRSQGM